MEVMTYSILLDFGKFCDMFIMALNSNFALFCILIGIKVGLTILKECAE